MGLSALDLDAEVRDICDLDRLVLAGVQRLGDILADLVRVDVETSDDLDVRDVVVAEDGVHQARDFSIRGGVLIKLKALNQGGGAVAEADDRDVDRAALGRCRGS